MLRFDLPPYAPQAEAPIIADIFERQVRSELSLSYLEEYRPYEMGVQSIDELPGPHREILIESCQRAESRFQHIRPRQESFYYDHHLAFVNNFVTEPGNSVLDTEHVLVIGPRIFSDQVLPLILARREDIVRISGREPEKFVVFIGGGETMERRYRSIGSSSPPYAYALTGALDCYLNTDYLAHGPHITDPAMMRAIWHEPAHVMWNSVLGKDMALIDIIVHEMLAGPLDPELWDDIDMPYHAMKPENLLDREISYEEWYGKYSQANGCLAPYFNKPIIKELVYRVKNLGYAALYKYALEGGPDVYRKFSRVW